MTMGRPTKYDPAFCEQVVEYMATGYSMTAFAGKIGVHRDTLREWAAVRPDFSDALKRGQAARTGFLEGRLLNDATPGPAMTGTIFALKNAAPDEWRDKQEIEHTGPGPITRVELVAPGSDDNSEA